jgi:hypothetical protein
MTKIGFGHSAAGLRRRIASRGFNGLEDAEFPWCAVRRPREASFFVGKSAKRLIRSNRIWATQRLPADALAVRLLLSRCVPDPSHRGCRRALVTLPCRVVSAAFHDAICRFAKEFNFSDGTHNAHSAFAMGEQSQFADRGRS